ncbi:hypothetical protein M405DRAFT_886369, partial [Rhizopogon salebrosus TDB-379]
MPEGPKFTTSDILLSVQTSLRDASSRETVPDSAPIPSGTEDQGHEIESSAPLNYEHPQEAQLASIDIRPISHATSGHPRSLHQGLADSFTMASQALSIAFLRCSLRDFTSLYHIRRRHYTIISELSQMRGAYLTLGQFMSTQGTHIHSPDVDKIFRCVQDSAHYMPDWQMQQVLQTSLGETRADNFVSFDRMPFATASIGQVHHAVLAPRQCPSGGGGQRVAVKIQFPNIANSIASDLGY